MTTNPIRNASAFPPAKPINWHEVASERNASMVRRDVEWVVNAKEDGIYLRSISDRNPNWREWKPEPGEIEATHDVVARAINVGLSMDQWREFVCNGTVTREVQKAMAERGV